MDRVPAELLCYRSHLAQSGSCSAAVILELMLSQTYVLLVGFCTHTKPLSSPGDGGTAASEVLIEDTVCTSQGLGMDG